MPRWWHRPWQWPALAGLVFCACVRAGQPGLAPPQADALLQQTERVRTTDHPRFLHLLEGLHRDVHTLTSRQQWQLRYLDAWQAAYVGDYAHAEAMLREVIQHAGDRTLAAKATALLMSNLAFGRRYEEAYTLANRLAADLPQIHDRAARFIVLANLSQLLNFAGQTDQALNYARLMESTLPPGESLCDPLSKQAAALDSGNRLNSSSPELRRAIDACVAAGQPVFANAMRLVMGKRLLQEHHPSQAMALLVRISPDIKASRFYLHRLSWEVERAQAYHGLGNERAARQAALAAIAMAGVDDINVWLKEAYEVLFLVAKKRGDNATALAYYERYVAQEKGYLDDVSARALAYQVVQQQVLAGRLEAEALSKQNNILRLQRALDKKAVETGRLYNVLLLLTLASIVFWLLRLKRSQLRFKKLSRLDGLTGIFHHQHFISEVDRSLRLLEKKLVHACLITIDLDHFKQVNDTHGHAMGDAVLRRSVALCQQQLRPGDLFGRLGGEEFGVLLGGCSREQGIDIAHRIRLAIAQTPIRKDGAVVSVSVSIGLACTGTYGYGLQRLCKEADAALYRAKRAGRNCLFAEDAEDNMLVA